MLGMLETRKCITKGLASALRDREPEVRMAAGEVIEYRRDTTRHGSASGAVETWIEARPAGRSRAGNSIAPNEDACRASVMLSPAATRCRELVPAEPYCIHLRAAGPSASHFVDTEPRVDHLGRGAAPGAVFQRSNALLR